MKFASETHANKLNIASTLAGLRCRAVTIASAARLNDAAARQIYSQVNGEPSPSGQTPSDVKWFLANKRRRMHAAMICLSYAKYREHFAKMADSHGLAFALAYRLYVNLVGPDGAAITPERIYFLISSFQMSWKTIGEGGVTSFTSDNVKIMRCRCCDIPHLVEAHFVSYLCEKCEA